MYMYLSIQWEACENKIDIFTKTAFIFLSIHLYLNTLRLCEEQKNHGLVNKSLQD